MKKFFIQFPEVVSVMSEKKDGSMKLLKSSGLNLENRKTFFEKNGIREGSIVAAEIVHGTKVEIIDAFSPEFILEADGLITKDANIFLSVTVADCIPVYFFEPVQKIIGIIHCGWRGIASGIIENALGKVSQLEGKLENLKIAMGPGIGECHFEIKEDILENFFGYEEFIINKDGKIFVDLKGIILKKIFQLGVPKENIENDMTCTYCNYKLFSYRRDKPEIPEAMIAVIGMEK